MQFRLQITLGTTEDSAMSDAPAIAEALRKVADTLDSQYVGADPIEPVEVGEVGTVIRDFNGNRVGQWEVLPIEEGGPAENDGEVHPGTRVRHEAGPTGKVTKVYKDATAWVRWDNGTLTYVDTDALTILAPEASSDTYNRVRYGVPGSFRSEYDPDDYTAVSQRVGEHEERLAQNADD